MPRQSRPRWLPNLYGAKILKRGIEDDPSNFTRFFLLKRPGVAAGESRQMPSGRRPWCFRPETFLARCSAA